MSDHDESERCSNECPECWVHSGEPGGPVMMGLTPESRVRAEAAEGKGSEIDIDMVFFCGTCHLAWVGDGTIDFSEEPA